MELWIRNQDRENLVKVGLLEINERENDYAILTIYENRTANLGLYKSKERALEVLDEIQNLLKPVIITSGYECDIKDNLIDKTHFNLEIKPEKTEIQQITSYVYQMPEE